MSAPSFAELDRQVRTITQKPENEVTSADLETVTQYLQRPELDMGVSKEMLDFLDTPEQRAITRNMLARHLGLH